LIEAFLPFQPFLPGSDFFGGTSGAFSGGMASIDQVNGQLD